MRDLSRKKVFQRFLGVRQKTMQKEKGAQSVSVQNMLRQKICCVCQWVRLWNQTLFVQIKQEVQTEQLRLARHREQFNPVLKLQAFIATLLLLCVSFGCFFCPVQYRWMQAQYQLMFEEIDYTPSLLRFAQQTVGMLAIEVQAADAPVGASLVQYQPMEELQVPVTQYYISSGYGWRDDPFGDGLDFHQGVDFACAEGEAVFAVMDGIIERNYLSDSYGNCIYIRHADGSVTLYAHLQYAFARVGELVSAGTQIGTVGQTGAATGAHLHFEVIVNNERQDPSDALGLS